MRVLKRVLKKFFKNLNRVEKESRQKFSVDLFSQVERLSGQIFVDLLKNP